LFSCSFEIYLQNLHNVKEREEGKGDEYRQETNERAGKVIRERPEGGKMRKRWRERG
jgi:hypothetical protein